jgi:hypothetical protein
MEQLWIDSRISTQVLLKLFDAFEQTGFPLAIETVLRDSSIRTKTLSATQNNRSRKLTLQIREKFCDRHTQYPLHRIFSRNGTTVSFGRNIQRLRFNSNLVKSLFIFSIEDKSSSDQSSSCRTTLSDQYLHMFLEHSIRFNNPDDQTIEDAYLHILSYLIDTLSKTSDDNFCYQTSSLLQKCASEFTLQPLTIPSLFWPIWFRCSTYLINILNRTRSVELNNQRQEITIELLLCPFSFGDSQRLDYSYTFLWIQLFKALCRLVVLDDKHVIHLYLELFRHGLVFEQAINDRNNQRLFGFLLTIIKCLLKTFIEMDLSTIPKRSLSSITLCYTQLSIIINSILQRLLSNDENQTQWLLVGYCLIKSNHKISSNEQGKSYVFTYVRDLIVDLFTICKTCSQLEIILTNLTQILSFLHAYEQFINSISRLDSSTNKQPQADNIILNKIISTIQSVFESTNGLSLLQLVYPLLILAFQHQKTAIRNKTRKCWNETFGRLTFIVYPNELR